MSVTGKTTRWILILAAIGVGFLAMGAVGVAGWEFTNSDYFCSNACHDVHPENTYSHQISQHASVDCVECHVGRISAFKALAVKSTHVGHAWALLVGYDRPVGSHSLPPSREACESCHSQEPHQNNSVRFRTHFAPDEKNTETRVGLIVRTAGIQSRDSRRRGVHSHLENTVKFIATAHQKQEIPWVQVTRPDGTTVTYADSQKQLTEDEIAAADIHTMQCIDCHNRAAHPFKNPEETVDDALANGKLEKRFPYVKARVSDLLHKQFDSEESAMRLVEEAWAQYQKDFPNLAEEQPEAWAAAKKHVHEMQTFAASLLARSKFLDPEVSWRSFPDNRGHKYDPGCFRCHSGRHKDTQGNIIPVNCTTCHTVPIIVRGGQVPRTFLKTLYYQRPASHAEPHFTATHRAMVDDTCQACHGEIRFGVDDQTFCGNSGCHGQKWPGLNVTGG
ncbi:MAG: NapC/NirT family cytochrome c [Gammaproteobacteria bacterium]|nr:NapC/NirT family cytochrome c [Gammaproteobacteria bacterium]MDJ0872342.1 NapC/NirT family cytochrome c [Gammaproteobacteria bacterium]MDJ0889742.1 NapC/NirT family cytochrome c [Gammaproteobacteria bacterium]